MVARRNRHATTQVMIQTQALCLCARPSHLRAGPATINSPLLSPPKAALPLLSTTASAFQDEFVEQWLHCTSYRQAGNVLVSIYVNGRWRFSGA